MPSRHRFFITLAASVGAALAQAPSVSVEMLPLGSADAYVNPNFAPLVTSNVTLTPGIAPLGTVWSNRAQHLASYSESTIEVASMPLAPAAVIGFKVTGKSVSVSNPPAGPFSVATGTSMDAAARVTLTAPNTVGGRLALRYTGSISDFGHSDIDVDLGADGTIDLAVSAGVFPSGTWRDIEFPAVLSGAPYVIDLHFSHSCGTSSVNSQFSGHGATAQIEAQFFPGQPAVQLFDVTGAGAGISAQHALDNSVFLATGGPPQLASVLVFGQQPTSVTITPLLTQLVTIDAVVFDSSVTLPLPLLPPGSALYCQGLVVDTGGVLRSTPSIRAVWP